MQKAFFQPGQQRARRVQFGEREVVRHGLERRFWQDLYHYCMTISWPLFLTSWADLFIMFNLMFSTFF